MKKNKKIKYQFGLIKEEGLFNETSTDIYYRNHFRGYKPVQSKEIFGLINSTDGNFWTIGEDDDHYWTEAKISEEKIREIKIKLEKADFTGELSLDGDLINLNLISLHNNQIVKKTFHKDWIKAVIKVLDIDNPIKTKKEILAVWDKNIIPDRETYKYKTPEEYVYSQILKWPSIYADKNIELSKFRVYDKLINSLNSGDHRDCLEDFENTLFKKTEIDKERTKRYFSEITYTGYNKVEIIDLGERKLIRPDFSSIVVSDIFEEEKEKYAEVVHWTEYDPNNKFIDILEERLEIKKETEYNPYPNFTKKYSLLWTRPEIIKLFDKEWLNEIIWFYETSLKAIEGGCYKENRQFPTGSEKADKKRIKEWEERLKNERKTEIKRNFGVEFNGNVEEFLSNLWKKEKEVFESFIKETIELLKREIENK